MKKINNLNVSCLLFFMTNQMFSSTGINLIMTMSKQNSIYVPLISYFIGLIPFYIFIKYFNYKEKLNFFDKISFTYKKIGRIINFIVFLFIILYFIYSLSTLNNYVQSKYLNDTPSYIITILFLIPVIYLVNHDIYSICKVTLFLFIIYIVEYILSALGLISLIEIQNIMPFFETSIPNLLKSSMFYTCYFTFPMFLLLIIPKTDVKNPNKINKHLFLSYTFSNLIIFILLIFLIGVFGIDLALIFDYPIFELLSKINFFDFITHIENILSFIAVLTFFINTSLSLYAIKIYLKNNNKLYYTLIIICLFLTLILFKNHTVTNNFVRTFYIIVFIPTLLILLKKNKI